MPQNGAVLPHVYQVTKYDPADRDEHGQYVGAQEVTSDRGEYEAAYGRRLRSGCRSRSPLRTRARRSVLRAFRIRRG